MISYDKFMDVWSKGEIELLGPQSLSEEDHDAIMSHVDSIILAGNKIAELTGYSMGSVFCIKSMLATAFQEGYACREWEDNHPLDAGFESQPTDLSNLEW